MGMSVKDYECNTYYNIIQAIEGYISRRKHDEALMRRVAFFAYYGGGMGKKTDFGKMWRDPYENPAEGSDNDYNSKREAYREFLQSLKGKEY